MEILKNSVWKIEEFENFPTGKYRLLHVDPTDYFIIAFQISGDPTHERPIFAELGPFNEGIREQLILRDQFELPHYMCVDETQLNKKHIEQRDQSYKLIATLINDNNLLVELALSQRVKSINQHAKSKNVSSKTIYRLLKKYWKFGLTLNSLLPAFSNCGGFGKDKTAENMSLGKPRTSRTLAFQATRNFILKDVDKENFRKILKQTYFVPHRKSLNKTYKDMLRKYYSLEIKKANALNKPPVVPSLAQLRYWKDKLFDPAKTIESSTTKRDYLLNHRAVLASSSEKYTVPGSCFEIDATVADVHIVSAFSSSRLLGRPTIYSIVDRASGLVCGLNVSLFFASWRAARQALANAFLPKVSYCKEFGIDIQQQEWPAYHLPVTLMCDNGEMIGLNPQKFVVPLIELQFSPPYRPDFKHMVERRFGSMNTELIHDLLGTTRGGKVVRGEADPRKKAVYTLKEFTKLLIDAVLELNRTQSERVAISSRLLIENDLAPTPLNFWKIHVSQHKHALQLPDESSIIGQLYPPAEASVTRNGIEYNGLNYSCDRVIADNLASIARSRGRWTVNARINENTTNFIYVQFKKNEPFIKCNLLPKHKIHKDLPMYEVEVFNDWKADKLDTTPVSIESIESKDMRKEQEKAALTRATDKPEPFSKRTKNIRENRHTEINTMNNPTEPVGEDHKTIQIDDSIKPKVIKLPRRPKRDK